MLQSLPKSVYNLFRHRYDSDSKTSHNDLEQEAFSFRRIIKTDIIENERKYVLVTAFTQQGKTFLTIAAACIHLAMGHVPIMIVKDRLQMRQLMSRIHNETKELRARLKELGFLKKERKRFKESLYCDSTLGTLERDEFFIHLQQAFNGNRPRIVVAIHHENHLERIYREMMMATATSVLFIDEAHKLGGYKKLADDEGDLHNPDIGYDVNISAMKEMASKVYLITATPQDIMISEPNLFIRSILWLRCPANYIGVDRWKFKRVLPEPDDSTQALIQILADLSTAQPIERVDKFGQENKHPISVLSFSERINENQDLALQSFKHDAVPTCSEHQVVIDSMWVVITLNQAGIKLFHQSLIGDVITIGNETIRDYHNTGEFVFQKTQIGEVFHWLAHNGGTDRFPRSVIISYKSAEEGVTFCSTWSEDKEEDKSWHLTHVDAMGLSRTASCSAIEQRLGRVNGNHGDGIRPIIYCTEECQEKLIKSFNLHFEQVRACCERARMNDCQVMEFVCHHPLFSNQIPSRCYNISGARWKLTTKFNLDEDMENRTICESKTASKILQIINPVGYCDMIARTLDNECLTEQALALRAELKTKHDEYVQKNVPDKYWNKLKIAYKKKTKLVRKIVDAFVVADFESLSERKLSDICGGAFQYDNYNHWDCKHYKYHILDKTDKNKFNLRAEIVDKLELME